MSAHSQPQERPNGAPSAQPTPTSVPAPVKATPPPATGQEPAARVGAANLNGGWKATPVSIDPNWDTNRKENYVVAEMTVNDPDRLVPPGTPTTPNAPTLTFNIPSALDEDYAPPNGTGPAESDPLYYHWKCRGANNENFDSTLDQVGHGTLNASTAVWKIPAKPGRYTISVHVNDSCADRYPDSGSGFLNVPGQGHGSNDDRNDLRGVDKSITITVGEWSNIPILGDPAAVEDCPVGPITIEPNPTSIIAGEVISAHTVRLSVTARDRDTLAGQKHRDQLYTLWFPGSPEAAFPERPDASTKSVVCDQTGELDKDSILWRAPGIAGTYTVKVRINDTSVNNGVHNGGWDASGVGENKRNDVSKEITLAIVVRDPDVTISVEPREGTQTAKVLRRARAAQKRGAATAETILS